MSSDENVKTKKTKGKNPKKEFFIMLPVGVIILAAALVMLFVMYRPFVPWVKIVTSEEAGTYEKINKSDVRYRYEINGVEYEKVLKNVPYSAADTDPSNNNLRRIIYVNYDNPHDVKPGSQGGAFLLTVIIGFIIFGAFLPVFTFQQYQKGIVKKGIPQKATRAKC